MADDNRVRRTKQRIASRSAKYHKTPAPAAFHKRSSEVIGRQIITASERASMTASIGDALPRSLESGGPGACCLGNEVKP